MMEIKEKVKFEFKLFGFKFKICKDERVYTRTEWQNAIRKTYEKEIYHNVFAGEPLLNVESKCTKNS